VVEANATQQFTATGNDQFGAVMASQPAFIWTVDAGGQGTVDSNGLYTAPANWGGAVSVRARVGGISGSASVTVNGQPQAGAVGEDAVAWVYQLNSGFVVNSQTAFVPANLGNYTFTNVTPTATTDVWYGTDNVAHNVVKTGSATVVVTSTLAAGGVWTYSENLDSTIVVVTSPMFGGAGTGQTETITDHYLFLASGEAGVSSTFTLTAGGSDDIIGSATWTDTGGDATQSWTQETTHSTTVSNTTDLSTGIGSGSSTQGGGWTYDDLTTIPYASQDDGGAVGGTVTRDSHQDDSYQYTGDTGSWVVSHSGGLDYSDGGTYSAGSIAGTTTSSGGDTWGYDASWEEALASGGAWALNSGAA
jgi:hypothetical protein